MAFYIVLWCVLLLPLIVILMGYLGTKEQEKWIADPNAESKRLVRCEVWRVRFRRMTLAGLGACGLLLIGGTAIKNPSMIFWSFFLLIPVALLTFGWFINRFPYSRDRHGTYLPWRESARTNSHVDYPQWARLLIDWGPLTVSTLLIIIYGYRLFS